MKFKLFILAFIFPLASFGANTNLMDNLFLRQSLKQATNSAPVYTNLLNVTQIRGESNDGVFLIFQRETGLTLGTIERENSNIRLENNDTAAIEIGSGSVGVISAALNVNEGNANFGSIYTAIFNGDIIQGTSRSAVFNSAVTNNSSVQINGSLSVTNGITSTRDNSVSPQLRLRYDNSGTNHVDFLVDAFGSLRIQASQQNISDMILRPSGDLILGDVLVNNIKIGNTNANVPIYFFNNTVTNLTLFNSTATFGTNVNVASRNRGIVVSGINTITNSLIQVFSGTYSLIPELVTFQTAFAGVPTVVATKTDNSGTALNNDTIFVTNITTTSCVIGMRTSDGLSSAATITFNGMAIGRQ